MADATLDPRKVMTGHDGKLYVVVDGASIFMANVDTFQAQLNFQTLISTQLETDGHILFRVMFQVT